MGNHFENVADKKKAEEEEADYVKEELVKYKNEC